MNLDYLGLGRRIRYFRKALKLTQEDLAGMAKISLSFLGHIERGSRKASIETLLSIAVALNVSMDVLLMDSRQVDITDTVSESILLKLQNSLSHAIAELNDSMLLIAKDAGRQH